MNVWHDASKEKPDMFVSVLGHITDLDKEFPNVRECYDVGGLEKDGTCYFPALREHHKIDKWMDMPEWEGKM